MADIIVDGTGTGFRAGVSLQNRLLTESKSRPSEEIDSERGNAFILHSRCHTANTASGGLMYFKNMSPSLSVFLTRMYVDAHLLSQPIIVSILKKPTTVIGGFDISKAGVIQKNYGLANVLEGLLLTSNATNDITFTGGTEYHSFPVLSNTTQVRELKGTNILTPNSDVLWGWETESGLAIDGEIISLSINIFIKEI